MSLSPLERWRSILLQFRIRSDSLATWGWRFGDWAGPCVSSRVESERCPLQHGAVADRHGSKNQISSELQDAPLEKLICRNHRQILVDRLELLDARGLF